MTLQEALASGKRFTRPVLSGEVGYFTADDIGDSVVLSTADVLATDYVTKDDSVTLTLGEFTAAWDDVARTFSNVKSSGTSPLFAKLVASLFE